MTRFATALSLAVLGTLITVAPAQALPLGTTSQPSGSTTSGSCPNANTAAVQTATDSNYHYRVPAGGGAVDSWSFNTSGATPGTPYGLLITRGSRAGGTFSIVGSDVETVPPSAPSTATFTLTSPIEVQAGDALGVETFSNTTVSCLFENGPLTAADVVGLGNPSGNSVNLTPAFSSALVNVSADLVQSEDVGVTQRALPASITTGGDGVLVLSVTRGGVSDGPVTVSDTVPAGLSIVSVSPGPQTCSVSGQTVTCTLPSASDSGVAIAVSAPRAGAYSNTAAVNGPLSDPNPANNSASATLDVTTPPVQNPTPRCHVVSLKDVPLAEAKAVVRALGCTVGKVSAKHSKSVPKGDVISTKPGAGRTAPLGTKVAIVSSSGKPKPKKHKTG
jgi:hypothetical protein